MKKTSDIRKLNVDEKLKEFVRKQRQELQQ